MNRPRARFRWLPTQPMTILERITSRRNARLLFRRLSIFLILVTASTVVFQVLMDMEGQRHSWLTGLYWTFTTMTTLGLGDIAFTSDLGRMFTVGVLVAGVTFLLVMLPFTLIQLFQSSARIPRELPIGTRGHVADAARSGCERAHRETQPARVSLRGNSGNISYGSIRTMLRPRAF